MKRAASLVALALAAAGCAAPLSPPVLAPAPPAAVVAPPRTAPAPAAAVRDSSPTPDALAVLASIPEPLGGLPPTVRPAPPEPPETPRAEPPARDVPVPARTEPLGSPQPLPAAAPPPVAPPPVAPPAVAPAATAPAAPDTCWRVQVAAPADREKGRAVRDAAESLLMVPMIVDREGGRFKVRSRDCLSRRAAESLRDRAAQSGFPGVFLVRLAGSR